MPYQIKNGIVYGSNAVSLTQAQYDALSTAEKNNGTVYYIYDSDDAVFDAEDVGLADGGNVQTLAGSVAVIETSPATATHAVGDYIVWNGQLYEVITAIAVGETLTVGTNITATTVGSELTALNNKYYYRDYSFTLSYSGGTIGTRGAQGYFGLDSDAVAVSATITYVSSSDRFIPVVFTSTSSGTNPAIYCNLYRCDTNSLSSAPQVTVRVLYRRN